MKNFILLPALLLCLASGLRADDDCSKSADACKPQPQKITPFMAEIKKAQNAPELKQGVVKETALKQGEAKESALKQNEPKPQFVSKFEAVEVPVAAPAQKEALARPAWLLLVGALLAGLYYFLKEGKAKRKRS